MKEIENNAVLIQTATNFLFLLYLVMEGNIYGIDHKFVHKSNMRFENAGKKIYGVHVADQTLSHYRIYILYTYIHVTYTMRSMSKSIRFYVSIQL